MEIKAQRLIRESFNLVTEVTSTQAKVNKYLNS